MNRTKPLTRKSPMSRNKADRKTGATTLRTRQRAVTAEERELWDAMAKQVGCIACRIEGHFNDYVSIHHIDGRTKPGCHKRVLPLCAGHHQDGAGEDKSMIAVHPHKARFEQRYGSQEALMTQALEILGIAL